MTSDAVCICVDQNNLAADRLLNICFIQGLLSSSQIFSGLNLEKVLLIIILKKEDNSKFELGRFSFMVDPSVDFKLNFYCSDARLLDLLKINLVKVFMLSLISPVACFGWKLSPLSYFFSALFRRF